MALIELIMPKMGESIIEATILKWNKNVGDAVKIDDTIVEIATDKVDSEIPSPTDGVITEIKYVENSVVAVGQVIAIISTDGENPTISPSPSVIEVAQDQKEHVSNAESILKDEIDQITEAVKSPYEAKDRFYSPLVKNIAKSENISVEELDQIQGSGANGRVTKQDIIGYLEVRHETPKTNAKTTEHIPYKVDTPVTSKPTSLSGDVEIIEMDRMRKLIADHMVMSKQTSPHVTSFVEADVTNIVRWREKNKQKFEEVNKTKLTYTPIFIDAVVKALKDYPLVNISLEGNKILVKKSINIGMAAALPSGNLIVPVIKNADKLNLSGLAHMVNDLAQRARANKLKPEEIQDGTFTITNVGTFGNLMGTPIINQPQVAILATGAIVKKPAVIETEHGDVIAIRHMMFLSLSYDHRIVDGSLGGAFLKRISDHLEAFDPKKLI